jgi:Fe2+ transport system protein FeoA
MNPLIIVKPGQKVKIKEIRGGKSFTSKLANMGLYSGVSIRVVSNFGQGPIIIVRNGIKFGIGFGMASRIFVELPAS